LLVAVVVAEAQAVTALETGVELAAALLEKMVTVLTIPHIGEEVVPNQLLAQPLLAIVQTQQHNRGPYRAVALPPMRMVVRGAVVIGVDQLVVIAVDPVQWAEVAVALAT
jgi:hypothetical protein